MRQPSNTPGLGRAIAALAVAIQGLTDEAALGGFDRKRLEWHCKRLTAAQAVLILTAHEPLQAVTVDSLQSDSIGCVVNAFRDGLEVSRPVADQAFRDSLASVLGAAV